MTEQFELADPPSDGISSVCFSGNEPNLLLVGSWDKGVRLYDVESNQCRWTYHQKAAVLDVCWGSAFEGFSGGLDRTVRSVDISTGKDTELGQHDDAVRCVKYSEQLKTVMTGGWDKTVRAWDPRTPKAAVGVYTQPEKIFSMDIAHDKVVVAMAGRKVNIFDVRNMKETLQRRESSLKFMTRMVKCMPNGDGYANSSIEGRIAVEFFNPALEWQNKKYAFKCHRIKEGDGETVYPVNAIAYHPIHGTFASGGGDGAVNMWDGFNKKRLRSFPRYPTSIASLSFNSNGKLLAVASSYTYEEGEKDHAPDTIYIRPVSDAEAMPKTVAA
ncbi:hypothetical protein HK104_006243 [Borealophlyctis nickersoniae]|nr:hypothetical protein HK104_006243 [Borealophlyctis nickersoniae]